MAELNVRHNTVLRYDILEPLIAASIDEGYTFVRQLWDEYESGVNRFDTGGAALYDVHSGDTLAGIGGVHTDPYLKRADIGRIRHVYVLPAYRRSGVGRALMAALIDHARQRYSSLTLRTPTAHGDAFYTAIGFSREPRFEQATHWMQLAPESAMNDERGGR